MSSGNLREKTEELYDEALRMIVSVSKKTGLDLSTIADCDDEEIVMVRDCFKIMNMSKELAYDYANALDRLESIENKLDVLMVSNGLKTKK